jgi:hypothetical protein
MYSMKYIVEITDHGFVKMMPLPARLTAVEVSRLLGIHREDVVYLARAKALITFGNPRRNQEKFFVADEILAKSQNKKWLGKVTQMIYGEHRRRNGCYETNGKLPAKLPATISDD